TDAAGNTTTCIFTVLVKGAPVALDDAVTTNEDTAVMISVLDNDSDPDGDPLTIISNTNPSNGIVVLNENGTFTYTPNANYNGQDSFEYTISDGNGGIDTATVLITVVPVNDAPVAVDDSSTTDEDTAVTISVLDN
ncbi:cadherin-like domain-containing protein, partial [Gillisia marina]|uniref:cadherin-like domain-containing protein n=1 Tax=Gillisia marina TaxID=1167637 RepID=UPI00029A9473